MTTIQQLTLGRGERGIIVGRAGTGKSTLGKYLLPSKGNLAILDPKRDFDYNHDIKVYDSANKILRDKPDRFIYRPEEKQFRDFNEYDKVLHYVYKKGNIFLFIDDIVGIVSPTKYPPNLQLCYQLGRSKGISIASCTQRPTFIPGFMVTECNSMYVFDLHNENDRKKMYDIGRYDPTKLKDSHTFAFYSCKTNSVHYLKLNLGRK